jgi:hypothetical protein
MIVSGALPPDCGGPRPGSPGAGPAAAMAPHEQALAEISAAPELAERMLRLCLYQSEYAHPQGWQHVEEVLYPVCPEYEPSVPRRPFAR